MANFRIYRTIPSAVRAIRLHPNNIERVANRCGAVLLVERGSTPGEMKYSGIKMQNQFGKEVDIPYGWFVVIRSAKDGGGYAAYSPEDFFDRYE